MIIANFVISERTTFLFLMGSNIVFIAAGFGLLTYGLIRQVSSPSFVTEAVDSFSYDGTMTIVTGLFEIALGSFGIAGAWFRKRIMLMVFAAILGASIVLNLTYMINTIVFTMQDHTETSQKLQNSVIIGYGNNSNANTRKLTVEVDVYQNKQQCCGWSENIEGNIFLKTVWYTQFNVNDMNISLRTLPDSCCQRANADCYTTKDIKKARDNRFVFPIDCLDLISSGVKIGLWMASLQVFAVLILQTTAATFTVLHLMQSGMQSGAPSAPAGPPPPE